MNTTSLPSVLPNNLLDLFYEIAMDTGKVAMEYYGSQLKVEYKDDMSPLTLADKLVDGIIHERLSKAFPEIPIISEERPHDHPDRDISAMFFLIDPIDGTKEFIHKRDNFTVNIALIKNGLPIAGLLYAPALGRLFLADVLAKICLEHRVPTQFNGLLHKTRAIQHHLEEGKDDFPATLLTSVSHSNPLDEKFIEINAISEDQILRAGSSIKFALIAAGEGQVYPRFNRTMEWDTAAGQAVLVAAGGSVVNFDGKPLLYGKLGLENSNFIAKATPADVPQNFKLPQK